MLSFVFLSKSSLILLIHKLLLQIVVIKFEIHQFKLKVDAFGLYAVGIGHHCFVFRSRYNIVAARDECQHQNAMGGYLSSRSIEVRSLSLCRRPKRCLFGNRHPAACSRSRCCFRRPTMRDTGQRSLPLASRSSCHRKRTIVEGKPLLMSCLSYKPFSSSSFQLSAIRFSQSLLSFSLFFFTLFFWAIAMRSCSSQVIGGIFVSSSRE